jgi:hypothetical protein
MITPLPLHRALLISFVLTVSGAVRAAEAPAPAAAQGRGGAGRGAAGGGGGPAEVIPPAPEPMLLYTDSRAAASTIHDRDPGYRPSYLVYVDTQRTAEDAKKLVEELGLPAHLQEYKTQVYVYGPANGTAFEPAADFAAFKNFLRAHRSSNLKVIGVGAGATFVNNVISRHAYAVAGILTYGGAVTGTSTMPVPAYVHAADAAVGGLYVTANGATNKVETDAATVYSNPGAYKELQRVVVSKLGDDRENLAQAFQNAWQTVFSKNFRYYMSEVESYAPGFDPTEHAEPWEIEPYVMYDELKLRYETIVEELPGLTLPPPAAGRGAPAAAPAAGAPVAAAATPPATPLSLRYEYVPTAVLNAPRQSVPLVVMLHGNMNDPRTQGESSGWPFVAAKNNLILISVEWQGRTAQGTTYSAIGEKGTMIIIDKVLAKYPQIDPGRVYFTGLSAGAANSMSYGLNNIPRIAAIAPASAPFGSAVEAAQRVKGNGNYLPMFFIAGTRDMYKPIPVATTGRSLYSAIQAFALLNDITVPEAPDLNVNEIFGLKLDNQAWTAFAFSRAMVGTLSNQQGVMIKLVGLDPYGHWNYTPAAAEMWKFLSQYRRDPATGKLQILPAR